MSNNNIAKYWITVLPFGEENAIHQKELAKKLDMTPDQVKVSIREARICGVEICSSGAGYYIPKNDLERRKFVNLQTKHAGTRFKTSKAMRKNLSNIKGQMTIDDTEEKTDE